jgi:hypothetical protein
MLQCFYVYLRNKHDIDYLTFRTKRYVVFPESPWQTRCAEIISAFVGRPLLRHRFLSDVLGELVNLESSMDRLKVELKKAKEKSAQSEKSGSKKAEDMSGQSDKDGLKIAKSTREQFDQTVAKKVRYTRIFFSDFYIPNCYGGNCTVFN